jgi:hypothetical protein
MTYYRVRDIVRNVCRANAEREMVGRWTWPNKLEYDLYKGFYERVSTITGNMIEMIAGHRYFRQEDDSDDNEL